MRGRPSRPFACTLAALFVALCAPLAGGCHGLAKAPTQPQDDASFSAPQQVAPPGMADDPPLPETLLPGDVLAVKTVSVAPIELSGVTVDATGTAHLPLAGAVQVAGLTVEQAAERVEKAMQPFDKFGRVLLTISEPAGHRVTVSGLVHAPGSVVLRPGARVADVVLQAGGPERQLLADGLSHDVADLEGARVIRDGQALPVSVARALEGDARHNVRVRPGDVVYVPPATGRAITVLGMVSRGTALPFHNGMRLTQALALAGGFAQGADKGDIRVIRGELSHPRVYLASVSDLVDGKASDVVLAPGDVVFVTESTFHSVTEVIQRITPLVWATSLGASLGVSLGL